jgi:hypothetical protein
MSFQLWRSAQRNISFNCWKKGRNETTIKIAYLFLIRTLQSIRGNIMKDKLYCAYIKLSYPLIYPHFVLPIYTQYPIMTKWKHVFRYCHICPDEVRLQETTTLQIISQPQQRRRDLGVWRCGGFMTPHAPGKSQGTDKFLCPVTMENQPHNIKHEIKGLWNHGFHQPQWCAWL